MEQADPLLGSLISDRYRLQERIASTDISVVYAAKDTVTMGPCAVKILHAARDDVAQRCLREAEAMARVINPHVVEALDHGILPSRNVFITMEYLEGESLADLVAREGALHWRRVIKFGRQLAEAVAATHAQGIIHRDVKPSNCMRITQGGDKDFLKLLDFGISRNIDARFPTLTSHGAVLGTPAYMAPELTATGDPTVVSDVYSFGCTLYHLLTGVLPFTGETLVDYYYHHCYTTLTPPSERIPGLVVPEGLEEVILRAMDKTPEDRFHSLVAAARALDALLPPEERPPPLDIPEPPPPWVPPALRSTIPTITSARVLDEAATRLRVAGAMSTPSPKLPTPPPSSAASSSSPGRERDSTPPEATELGDGTPLPFAATHEAATPGLPRRLRRKQPLEPDPEQPLRAPELILRGVLLVVVVILWIIGWRLLAPGPAPPPPMNDGDGLWVTAPPPLRALPGSRRLPPPRTDAAPTKPPTQSTEPRTTPATVAPTPALVPPPAPAEPTAPEVTPDPPSTQAPPFPSREARRRVRSALPGLRRCAESHRVTHSMKLRISVDGGGAVATVTIRSPRSASDALQRCVDGQLIPISLPIHPGGGSFDLTVDLPVAPAFLPLKGSVP